MNLDLGLADFSGIFEVKVECQRDPLSNTKHHSTHVGPYFKGSSQNLENLEPLQRSNAAKGEGCLAPRGAVLSLLVLHSQRRGAGSRLNGHP